MNKIIVFANVPAHSFAYKKLPKNRFIILTDNRFFNEYKNKNYENIYGFNNYSNNENVLLRAIKLVKQFNIKTILVSDESDVERAGFLRDLLKLEGQKTLSSKLYRDKLWMKLMLHSIVPIPKFKLVHTKEEAEKFAEDNGYPIVLKPRSGWSSLKTYKITHQNQLDEIKSFDEFLVEEWINNSTMYTIDGIQKNGKVIWYSIHQYDCNVLESLELGKRGFSMITSPKMFDEAFKSKAKYFTETVIQALNSAEKFCSPFHLEFFSNDNEDFIFCEIASRFGGGKTLDLIEYEYNLNLPSLYLKEIENNNTVDWETSTPKQFVACYKKFFSINKKFIEDIRIKNFIISANKVKFKNEWRIPKSINDVEELYILKSSSFEETLDLIHQLSAEKFT